MAASFFSCIWRAVFDNVTIRRAVRLSYRSLPSQPTHYFLYFLAFTFFFISFTLSLRGTDWQPNGVMVGAEALRPRSAETPLWTAAAGRSYVSALDSLAVAAAADYLGRRA